MLSVAYARMATGNVPRVTSLARGSSAAAHGTARSVVCRDRRSQRALELLDRLVSRALLRCRSPSWIPRWIRCVHFRDFRTFGAASRRRAGAPRPPTDAAPTSRTYRSARRNRATSS